jgi:hypothetical protein
MNMSYNLFFLMGQNSSLNLEVSLLEKTFKYQFSLFKGCRNIQVFYCMSYLVDLFSGISPELSCLKYLPAY